MKSSLRKDLAILRKARGIGFQPVNSRLMPASHGHAGELITIFLSRPFGTKLLPVFAAILFLINSGAIAFSQESAPTKAVTGDLLTSLFSPVVASEPKAMAVFQRTNLLDRVSQSRSMQLALVVDATESMSTQLDGIRRKLGETVGSLQGILGDELSIQIILYRDLGADSVIEFPLPTPSHAFTRDKDEIEQGLAKLVPGSGAPYFLEPVDAGLYAALTDLPWSTDATVARWIMLIGDAPPFENTTADESGSLRKYSDDQLILLAKGKGINIHTVLCPTRDEDKVSYDLVLPKAKDFFSKIALNTEGVLFDLSDPKFRIEIESAAKRASVEYLPIAPVSEYDIQQVAEAAPIPLEARTNLPVTFAVLPFMPKQVEEFTKVDFFNPGKHPSLRLAEVLGKQLDDNGATIVKPIDIRNAAREVIKRAPSLRDAQAIKAIGNEALADYVICVHRTQKTNSSLVQYQYAIIETRRGEYIVKPQVAESEVQQLSLASDRLLNVFAKETKNIQAPSDLRSLMTKMAPNPPRIRNVSLAETKEAEELVVDARRALDEIVQFELITENDVSSKQIEASLSNAESLLDEALLLDKVSSTAHMMKANIAISRVLLKPEDPLKEQWIESASNALLAARKYVPKDRIMEAAEIEADTAIMEGEFATAASKYESILDPKTGNSDSTKLRARWMLMGIYSGDWNVASLAKDLVNATKARRYAIEILAFHPKSLHAERLRKTFQISGESPQSTSPKLPIQHDLGLSNGK
jgi:hypothetical protein